MMGGKKYSSSRLWLLHLATYAFSSRFATRPHHPSGAKRSARSPPPSRTGRGHYSRASVGEGLLVGPMPAST